MVVVTGADGQLGQALVRELVARGETVRILLTDIHSPGFDGIAVEKMTANILDPLSLINAFTGADVVYHCDSYLSLMPYEYQKMFKRNVKGTETVVHACRISRVRRLVYVSSILSFGFDSKARYLTELIGFRPQKAVSYYGRTMAMAAQRVERAQGDGLDAVILCPGALIGPYDYEISALGKVIWEFGRGRLPADSRGGFDVVDSRDLAKACVWASTVPKAGAVYLVSGGHLNTERLMRMLQRTTGQRRPWIHLPRWILYLMCLAYEVRAVFYGGQPVYTRAAALIIRINQRVVSQKLREEMGFETRPVKQSIADAWDWYREHHHYV